MDDNERCLPNPVDVGEDCGRTDITCGTRFAYQVKMCRGDKCRAWNTIYSRRRRARRRAEAAEAA